MHKHGQLLLLLPVAAALSGCVVAAVPVVVGGVAAKRMMDRKNGRKPATPAATGSRTAPITAASGTGDQRTAIDIHPGTLPPPDWAVPTPASASPPAPPPTRTPPAAETPWALLGRYIAGTVNNAPDHGALLARGSKADTPRWADCGDKPRVVLTSLDAVLADPNGARAVDGAPRWIEALQTMGVGLVVTSERPEAERASVAASLRKAGLSGPVGPDALRLDASAAALPGLRADIASRYCVVAVAGRVAADFPNALLPATSPPPLQSMWGAGWFLIEPSPTPP